MNTKLTLVAIVAFTVLGSGLTAPAEARRLSGQFKRSAAPPAPAQAPASPTVTKPFNDAVIGPQGIRPKPHFNDAVVKMPSSRVPGGQMEKRATVVKLPPPPNLGFAQGQGNLATHAPGTVFKRYGGPDGRYVTPDLGASRGALALPPTSAAEAPRFYRATKDITAPTGTVGPGYHQPGGATQVVLPKSVRDSPLQRTITPEFAGAAHHP